MSRFSITTRLVILAVVLLALLIASNVYLDSKLASTADSLGDQAEFVSVLTAANTANTAFGDLKYWLTDLSVSLLMHSQQKADVARIELDAALDELEFYDPEVALTVGIEVDALHAQMSLAVDAYTSNERVLGNSLMAGARTHIRAIDDYLTALVGRLQTEAQIKRNQGLDDANRAVVTSNWIVVLGSIFGLGMTVFILRSITTPLGRLVTSISEITRGNLDVGIPAETHDEIGVMSRTLRMFRDGLLEREHLAAERETAQQALERAQTQLTEAIEASSEAFALFDADDRLVLCNRKYRDMYEGLEAEVRPGVLYEDICRPVAESGIVVSARGRTEDWLQDRLRKHLNPPGPYEYELTNGRWLRVSEHKTQDGGIVGVFTDISDMKARESQLAEMVEHLEEARDLAMQATQAKSRFLANMSHELRTPLNAIIGYSEMLEEDASDRGDTDAVADLGKIHSAGRHLLSLINEILDLAKIEVGKMEVYLEDVDLKSLLDDVISTIQPVIKQRGNTLQVDIDSALGVTNTDHTKLRQMLLNLLSNAAKFTENGTIKLAARQAIREDNPWLYFSVTDTGIGMTQEQQEKVFDEFAQADASTTRKYEGTGLGLSISKHFCEMLGGSISVDSTEGKGSTFAFSLPTAAHVAVEGVPADSASLNGDASKGCKVLVIDDDETVRNLISRILIKEGFQVSCAGSGKEGLELARQIQPDVISLDVLMPGMDGWSVLVQLKGDAATADTPVIILSILDEKKVGYTLGAADYLNKPIDRTRLIGVIDKHCRGKLVGPVLVVDDDPAIREIVAATLGGEGIDAVGAENGRDALECLAEVMPQLILLDLMMPEMDGFEFLEMLKARPEWREIPVVVITSRDLSSADHERLNGKVRQVISKGEYTESELLDKLRHVIRTVSKRACGSNGA